MATTGRPDTRAGVVTDWFDRYALDLGRYTARRVGPALARDIVADTFRIAFERLDQFDRRRGDARAWLYGIATNLIRRHRRTEERRLRNQARSAALVTPGADPLLDVIDQIDARSRLDEVIDAVLGLEPDDRDLLFLIAWEDMSSRQAAEVLGIPPGTVRSRLNRIRGQLRHAVSEGEVHG